MKRKTTSMMTRIAVLMLAIIRGSLTLSLCQVAFAAEGDGTVEQLWFHLQETGTTLYKDLSGAYLSPALFCFKLYHICKKVKIRK